MKKTIILLLMLCLCFGLCACGGSDQEATNEPAEEVKQVPCLQKVSFTILNENEYTVGTNMTLNEFGQIVQLDQRYNIIDVTYDENHRVIKVTETDKDEDRVGYESFTYDSSGMLVGNERDLNDGFTNINVKEITNETDAEGRVIKRIENISATDAKDGSVTYSVDTYEFEYDENGYITELRWYNDGEFDHTAYFTYDEYGNILSNYYIGSDGEEYLRFDFTYVMVDETEVSPLNLDPLTIYTNWECLIDHML